MVANRLEYAVGKVNKELNLNKVSVDWTKLEEEKLWYELTACILGSKVHYELAKAANEYLISENLLKINNFRYDICNLESNMILALEKRIFPPFTKKGGRKYRYPKLRANHLRRTGENIYMNKRSIKEILTYSKNERQARLEIINVGVGVGPKQASLFLRNVGFAKNLAILDTHVLKYMSLVGLICKVDNAVNSLGRYEQKEDILSMYAEKFRTTLACIDTAIWVVMRVCLQNNLL